MRANRYVQRAADSPGHNCVASTLLQVWLVRVRHGGRVACVLFHVINHTNDGEQGRISVVCAPLYAFADCIFAGEIALDEAGADNDDFCLAFAFGGSKKTTGDEMDADCAE